MRPPGLVLVGLVAFGGGDVTPLYLDSRERSCSAFVQCTDMTERECMNDCERSFITLTGRNISEAFAAAIDDCVAENCTQEFPGYLSTCHYQARSALVPSAKVVQTCDALQEVWDGPCQHSASAARSASTTPSASPMLPFKTSRAATARTVTHTATCYYDAVGIDPLFR